MKQLEEDIAKLVEEAHGRIDGLNIADILQRAATKEMKECLSGGAEGGERDEAIFGLLARSRQELIDELPKARERRQQWEKAARTAYEFLVT